VLAVLEAPPVQARFGFGERDLETIRHWIQQTRIRWGRDATDRAKAGLPPLAQNTWRSGLDRLLLGYAIAGQERKMFGEILPFDEIEGESAVVLGRFAEFLERLFATLALCEQPHTLRDWTTFLLRALNDFFPCDDDAAEPELRQVRIAIARLAKHQDQSGYDAPVDLAVILEQLAHDLAEDTFGSGFLAGGVTFCALKPMRSIPFKIICIVGLDDGAFPRATPQLGFDLMAEMPRRGDRSMRDDDRYLFLETLLSARQRLYLSYVGQSARDNSVRPPSVLIGELLDYVEQGFDVSSDDGRDGFHSVPDVSNENKDAVERVPTGSIRHHLVRTHRLQAFSEDYFRVATGLFSYSAENCQAGRERLGKRGGPSAFFPAPLAEPEPEWRTVDLASLISFFKNPAKFLLERRLGMKFTEGEAALDDREPFEVVGREKYQIEQEVLERVVAGEAPAQTAKILRAGGSLPLGRAGEAALTALQRDAADFCERLARFAPDKPRPPLALDLALGEFQLTGRLDHLTATNLLRFRCAKIKAADLLAVWIEHLAWNALRPAGDSLTSAVVARDATFLFAPIADSSTQLKSLLALYWRGLRSPLKFFPESARKFSVAERNAATGGRARKSPLEAARVVWEGSSFQNGPRAERDDPWFALCFRDLDDPLDEEFVELSRSVFEPLLACAQKGED
jgi:exodeoxyribonuclease V gamma subunit